MKDLSGKLASVLLVFVLLFSLCGFSAAEPPVPRLINEQEFTTADLTGLQVSYAADKITLLESSSGKILLKEYCSYDDPSYYANVATVDGVLKINGGKRPKNTSYSAYIEVFVPSDFAGNIKLDTASGKIESAGTSFSVPVSLSSASGKIALSDIAFVFDLNTASGQIEVEGTSLHGRIHTASGKVVVETDVLGGDLEIMVASGKVEVGLSSSAAFLLKAEASTGKITNEFSGTTARKQSMPYGSNPVHTMEIEVASGNIDILKR